MKPVLFSMVSNRKLALQKESSISKISYKSAYYNPSVNNLLLFMESSEKDCDKHFKDSVSLYNKLLQDKEISEQHKRQIENTFYSKLINVKDLDSVYSLLENCLDKELYNYCYSKIQALENCDRVIRNEAKLLKRFDLNKIINENIARGTRHTVFELCSLLDTYSISSKAKLNIALENVSYALFKSGHDVDLNEASEYIVEYFLTRDVVITDKEYKGYIDVLENNNFIDRDRNELNYVFKTNEDGYNSFAKKLVDMSDMCEDPQYKIHIRKALNIRNEKDASQYIDDTILMIIDDETSVQDASLLFNSIYIIPLIGRVSDDFVNYKMELNRRKIDIKQKLSSLANQDLIKETLDDGTLLDFANLISNTVHYENYILDDYYKDETDPVKILEGANDNKMIADIIKSFKASNEKSPSKFKNMITRIMTKSPQNIIDETPSIFSVVRIMLYLGVAAAFPLGPVFSGILILIDKLVSTHLNIKEAEKLLRHLRTEKKNAENKLDKLSSKEKDNQKEYIECLDKCIKKVEKYISDLDDENEEVYNTDSDDDFDFGDFDFDLESVMESGSLINTPLPQELLDMISKDTDEEILDSLSILFDNSYYSAEFYAAVENVNENGKFDSILKNKGSNTVYLDTEVPSVIAQFESAEIIKDILNEAIVNKDKKKEPFTLNTLKMATINFRKKFRDISGKEKEFWRNIDIATVNLYKGLQQALTSDRREAIIKGSIIPSFSKCIKYLMAIAGAGFIGSFAGVGVVSAAITAVGIFGASKALNERERRLLYDEIDTELQVVEKQIQLAENEGDMNQYRFLLNYQKKLTREKYRIKYGMHAAGRDIPEIRRGRD